MKQGTDRLTTGFLVNGQPQRPKVVELEGKTECCKKHGRWTTWKGCKCIQHHRSCPECGPRRSVSVSDECILVPTFRDRLNHMAAYSRRTI